MRRSNGFILNCTLVGLAITLVLVSPWSVAQENEYESDKKSSDTVQRLQGVVVSASRTEEDVADLVKSADWVDQEAIERSQSGSVAETVSGLANVEIEGGPRPLSQEISIRGIGGNRVVRLIDGTRQNFSSGHRGSFYVDPAFLKGVEVVRGASGSAWGSGSIGGVVNMVTKDATDFLQANETFGAQLGYGAGSVAEAKKLNAALYGTAGEQSDYLLNIISRDAGDIELGNGETLSNSALESQAVLAKYRWRFNERQHLQLSFNGLDADQQVPSNPSTNTAPGPNSSNPLLERNTQQANWQLVYTNSDAVNPWLDLSVNLYQNTTEVTEDCLGACGDVLGGPARHDTSEFMTQGVSLQNTSGSEAVQVNYGIDYYHDEINSSRNGAPREQFPPSESDVTAAFVRVQFALGNSFYLTPAVRYDQFEHAAADSTLPAVDESERSDSLSARWQPSAWFTLTAAYDEAFRAPGLLELYPTGVHFDLFAEGAINPANSPFPGVLASPALNNVFIPNPELKPERAENKELSARFKFSELAGNDELRIRATMFQNDIEDFIGQNVLVDIEHYMNAYFSTAFNPAVDFDDVFDQNLVSTQNRNVSSAEFKGYELDIAYDIGGTHLALSYGETEATDRDSGEPLDVPADRWVLDASQDFLQGDLAVGLRVTQADNLKSTTEGLDDVDGYTVADVYLAWEPTRAALNGLRVDLAVSNLGDKDYQRNSFSLPSAGRDIQLTARYRF